MSILGFLRKFPSRIGSECGLSNSSRLVKVIFCLPLRFNVSWFGPQNARNAEMSWQWRPKELPTFSLQGSVWCAFWKKVGPTPWWQGLFCSWHWPCHIWTPPFPCRTQFCILACQSLQSCSIFFICPLVWGLTRTGAFLRPPFPYTSIHTIQSSLSSCAHL